MKKHIPNAITLGNLLCGTTSIYLIFHGNPTVAAYLIFTGALLDFFDGAAARVLNAYGPLGKQLDSLADMVTFGLAPGFLAYHLIDTIPESGWLGFIAFLIPVFSALRLAKFNIDERQSTSFIGLPTPANGFFWAGLVLVPTELLSNAYILAGLVVVMALLLVSPLSMFSLKFKHLKWNENKQRYTFLLISLILILLLSFTAIPIIILLYIIFSIVQHLAFKEE